jgi:hypothetical protein
MEISCELRSLTLLVLAAISATNAAGQAALLKGTVNEIGGGPIGGVRVIIDGKVVGVTGEAGNYEISKLQVGKLQVAYTKVGYGAIKEPITVSSPQTEHNVGLFKDTAEASYWDHVSQSINGSPVALWTDVEKSGLSPQSKAAGAQKISIKIPIATAPASLSAYRQVTPEQIEYAESWMAAAAAGTVPKASPPRLPQPVLLDVAMWTIQEDDGKKKYVLENLSVAYGADASADFRRTMTMQASAGK